MADHVELVELEAIVADVVLAVVEGEFIHLADVLSLPLVHIGEVNEYVALGLLLPEDIEHFESGVGVETVAVFALDHLLSVHVGQPCEVLVIHIFDVHPLDLEIAFEF